MTSLFVVNPYPLSFVFIFSVVEQLSRIEITIEKETDERAQKVKSLMRERERDRTGYSMRVEYYK